MEEKSDCEGVKALPYIDEESREIRSASGKFTKSVKQSALDICDDFSIKRDFKIP